MSFIWRNFYWLNKVHVHVFDGFSYLWHVVTGPTYTWPPTDPVWSALRPTHHYPHTPRVPPSTHSHPSTTSKSRTVDDCSQLGFYNEWEKLCAKDLPFEKKNPQNFWEWTCLFPKLLLVYIVPYVVSFWTDITGHCWWRGLFGVFSTKQLYFSSVH